MAFRPSGLSTEVLFIVELLTSDFLSAFLPSDVILITSISCNCQNFPQFRVLAVHGIIKYNGELPFTAPRAWRSM